MVDNSEDANLRIEALRLSIGSFREDPTADSGQIVSRAIDFYNFMITERVKNTGRADRE